MTGGAKVGRTLRRDALADWLATASPRAAAVLVDPGVAGSEIACAVADAVGMAVPATDVVEVRGGGGLPEAKTLAGALSGRDAVVAVGGGRVLDQAKLATVLAGCEQVTALLEDGSASGYRFLPDHVRRAVALVAVPTTIGTGSERSQNAVLEVEDGRLLVGGGALRADLVVHDGPATRDLPRLLVLQGVFEALNRTIGPFVGSGVAQRGQDSLAEAVCVRLARVGHELHARHEPGDPASDDLRLEVARLGALSQTPAMHAGRDPFGFKAWYLAHELAWVAGIDKAHAQAAVLPPMWSEILLGNSSAGSVERLRRVWTGIAATAPGLGSEPDRGLCDLIDLWELPRAVTQPVDASALAARIERRWGGDQPFLRGLDGGALRRVLAQAVA